MRLRIAGLVAVLSALVGCGSDNQEKKTAAAPVAASPGVDQAKPKPAPPPVSTAAAEPPPPISPAAAKSKPKPAAHKVRHAVATPAEPCALEESRACELANEIREVTVAERIAWAKQEFAKREIRDVRADR